MKALGSAEIIILRWWNTVSSSKSDSIPSRLPHISHPQSHFRYHLPKCMRRKPTSLVLSLEPSLLAHAQWGIRARSAGCRRHGSLFLVFTRSLRLDVTCTFVRLITLFPNSLVVLFYTPRLYMLINLSRFFRSFVRLVRSP